MTSIVDVSYPNVVHFYGDNALGGASIFGCGPSGVSPQPTTTWIPVASDGTINVLSQSDASGTSLFVHGVKIR